MESQTQVSTDFSKNLYGYLKKKYKLGTGIFQTSRKVYTSMDKMSFAREKFILEDPAIKKKRQANFNYYLTVKALNDEDTFKEFLSCFKEIQGGLAFISGEELETLKELFVCSELDKMVDCIMITSFFKENVYILVADFITSVFDDKEELWED